MVEQSSRAGPSGHSKRGRSVVGRSRALFCRWRSSSSLVRASGGPGRCSCNGLARESGCGRPSTRRPEGGPQFRVFWPSPWVFLETLAAFFHLSSMSLACFSFSLFSCLSQEVSDSCLSSLATSFITITPSLFMSYFTSTCLLVLAASSNSFTNCFFSPFSHCLHSSCSAFSSSKTFNFSLPRLKADSCKRPSLSSYPNNDTFTVAVIRH